ncbi:hypothetical protein ACFLZX_00830 [Nanoarchaeota archaeon]
MYKHLIIICLVFLLVPVVLADNVELQNVKIYVDGDRQSGSVEIRPNSNLTIEIQVESDIEDEDTEVEEVNVEIIIEDLDDGRDIDYEFEEFSMEHSEEITLKKNIQVPYILDEETYLLTVKLKADDDEGNDYKDEDEFDLIVEKEQNEVVVSDYSFSPSDIQCDQDVTLNLEITNIGEEKEYNVIIELESNILDFNEKTNDIDLDEEGDDSQYEKDYTISIPENIKGSVQIKVSLTYDNDDITDETYIPFTVQCESKQVENPEPEEEPDTPVTPQEPKDEEENEEEDPIVPDTIDDDEETDPITITTEPSVLPNAGYISTEEKSFLDNFDETTTLIILGEILVIFIILFIILLIRSSK